MKSRFALRTDGGRETRMPRGEDRGAALLIAVAILLVLFIVALTFYSSSQVELQTATNVENTFRTDLIGNAGLTLAIAYLQNDKKLHPTATSLDHAWTTYFNGAWLAGKDWAFDPARPAPGGPYTLSQRVPWVDVVLNTDTGNYERVPYIPTIFWEDVRELDQLLYVPRIQPTDPLDFGGDFVVPYVFDPSQHSQVDDPAPPFLFDASYDYTNPSAGVSPKQQIHRWADVDNDEDGLRDSMWIPIAVEVFYGGIDKDGDGRVSALEGGDGIDNDLDGATDEPDEVALFVYWGGGDGLDNDGDNVIDEGDEQRLFLTAPLAASSVWGFPDGEDNDEDGTVDEADENRVFQLAVEVPLFNSIDLGITANLVTFQEFIGPDAPAGSLVVNNGRFSGDGDVDVIDNDFSMVINDVRGYVFNETGSVDTDRISRVSAYTFINTDVYSAGVPFNYVTASGEAVCTVGGRVAILITDEASKANLNTAGGIAVSDAENFDLVWALNKGVSGAEFDVRTLPNVGIATPGIFRPYLHAWQPAQFRNGTPDGNTYGVPGALPDGGSALLNDIALPGYGGVDDNANALWLMLDGIDNDGDATFFTSDGVDNDADGVTDEPDEARFGIDEFWEGVDEPEEFQSFRPYRNMVAENDTAVTDDDVDGSPNEIGEFGDQILRTADQVVQFTPNLANMDEGERIELLRTLRDVTTVQSADRNQRRQNYTLDQVGLATQQYPEPISGMKLDYNYVDAETIATALIEDWRYAPITNTLELIAGGAQPLTNAALYGRGLRRGDATVIGTGQVGVFNSSVGYILPADPELRAYQLAANTQDFRDRDSARKEVTVPIVDQWWSDVIDPADSRQISYTIAGLENIRINEIMARPVRRIEAEADSNAPLGSRRDPNFVSDVTGEADDDFNITVDTIDTQILNVQLPPAGQYGWELFGPVANDDQKPLGVKTGWVTNSDQLQDDIGNDYPNVIQFAINSSPELPPGRYYLVINTWGPNGVDDDGDRPTMDSDGLDNDNDGLIDEGANLNDDDGDGSTDEPDESEGVDELDEVYTPSATDPSHLDFLVKYSSVGADILGDLVAFGADITGTVPDPFLFTSAEDPIIGGLYAPAPLTPPAGEESGFVFLPTSAADETAGLPAGFEGYAGTGTAANMAFSVVVPPAGTTLYIAIRKGNNAFPLSINFLEFSQEPDHEWVEIVNIDQSGDPVNLSNWFLEVGASTGEGERQRFQIPGNTQIAPGGSLLLGFNKYDIGGDNFADLNFDNTYAVSKNGIGLVRGDILGDFGDITEPPLPSPYLLAPSVFYRDDGFDFIDRDGDGVADAANPDDDFASTVDTPPSGFEPFPSVTGVPASQRAWDRIVQLQPEPSSLLASVSESVETIAAMVLAGGVFPNRPDHDLVDNDGDSAVLLFDLIDNDGDGLIDEGDEGIDENWFRRQIETVLGDGESVPGSFSSDGVNFDLPVTDGYVTGSVSSWLEWHEFVERRYFPGDCVDVSLLDSQERIVDRVTYTQRDVENAAIDDVLPCTFAPEDTLNEALAFGDWPDNTMGLDFYRSIERKHPFFVGDRFGTQNRWQATDGNYDDWSPPANRIYWESATLRGLLNLDIDGIDNDGDGNADGADAELDESLAMRIATNGSPLRANFYTRVLQDPRVGDSDNTTYYPIIDDVDPGNLNSLYQWTFARGGVRNRALESPGDLLTMPRMTLVRDLTDQTFSYLGSYRVQGPVTEKGAMLGMDYPLDRRSVLETAALDSIVLGVGTAKFYPLFPFVDDVISTPVLAQWTTDNNRQVAAPPWLAQTPIAPRAWAPVFLTSLDTSVEPVDGVLASNGSSPGNAPFFTHLGDGYPVQMSFLLNPILDPTQLIPPPTIPATSLVQIAQLLTDPASAAASRWPAERRAMMYVSANPIGFNASVFTHSMTPANIGDATGPYPQNADEYPSEALFVWDGASGLPNGEYDVFVATYDDLSQIRGTIVAGSLNEDTSDIVTSTEVLVPYPADPQLVTPDDYAVDVEVFSDRDGDRAVWTDGIGPSANLPDSVELHRGPDDVLTPVNEAESFGLKAGLTPSADGLVHYGVIKVENNFLAVFVRNWGSASSPTRVSRVILTSREKTGGRINVNTAYTHMVYNPNNSTDTAPYKPHNTLIGTPGILATYDLANGINARPFADNDDIVPSDPLYQDAILRAHEIVGQRGIRPVDVTGDGEFTGEDIIATRLDGRYFIYPSELVALGDNPPLDSLLAAAAYVPQLLNFTAGKPLELAPPILARPDLTIVDDAERLEAQFDEMLQRYSRIANLVTTRSDTFEIAVTAQSGYIFDANNDGVLNWRDDNEFIITGERKTRTVYER